MSAAASILTTMLYSVIFLLFVSLGLEILPNTLGIITHLSGVHGNEVSWNKEYQPCDLQMSGKSLQTVT